MLRGAKARLLTVTAVLVFGVVGSAAASSSALAAQYNLTRSEGGAAVPLGTSYTMTSGAFEFTNNTGSAVYLRCSSTALSGATDSIVSGGPSAGVSVTGGSFSGCTVAGARSPISGSYSSPWQVTPTSGATSPFGGYISGVKMVLSCSSSSATFTGTLTGGTENNEASGSYISLPVVGALMKSGSGCAAFPALVYVDATYTMATVGGSPVSATNNLWLNYS